MDHRAEVEQLHAEYRRRREQLAAVHRGLAALAVSETSEDGAITVTVGPQGVLTGLQIDDRAYRYYRPQRLAEAVVALSAAAAARVTEQAVRLIEPVLPPGIDAAALLAGTADLRPAEIAPPPQGEDGLDEDEGSARSWLQRAYGGERR